MWLSIRFEFHLIHLTMLQLKRTNILLSTPTVVLLFILLKFISILILFLLIFQSLFCYFCSVLMPPRNESVLFLCIRSVTAAIVQKNVKTRMFFFWQVILQKKVKMKLLK